MPLSRNRWPIYAEHPAEYRREMLVEVNGKAVPYRDVADDWQERDAAADDPGWLRCLGRPVPAGSDVRLRSYLGRPRGHSKTSDIARRVRWALETAARPVFGYAVAADRDQAALIRQRILAEMRMNAAERGVLDVQNWRVVNVADGHPGNGSTLEILASDVASSFGILPDFIIADELTHWSDDGRLWQSILSSVAKRPNCMLTIITNAGHGAGQSWQWQVREHARTHQDANDGPAWHYSEMEGPQASWISEAVLNEQRRLLPPSAFARLWLNQWVSHGEGDYLNPAWIKRATTLAGEMHPDAIDHDCGIAVAGLDLSKFRDRSSLVVVFFDQLHERIELVAVREWLPGEDGEVSITAVRDEVLALKRLYKIRAVRSDTFAAFQMAEDLRLHGLPHHVHHSTLNDHTAMCNALLRVFREREIALYPHDGLIDDLHRVRIVERAGGKLKLEADRDERGHADSAFALTNAIWEGFSQMQAAAFADREPEYAYV